MVRFEQVLHPALLVQPRLVSFTLAVPQYQQSEATEQPALPLLVQRPQS